MVTQGKEKYPRLVGSYADFSHDFLYLPRDQIRVVQEKKLRQQVEYVYEHSQFYRQKFKEAGITPKDIQSLEDLAKIPFTTKQEIRENQKRVPPFGENICVSYEEIVWFPTTSGTTGVPTVLPRNNKDFDTWVAVNCRAYDVMGFNAHDVQQITWSYHHVLSGLLTHLGAQKVGLKVINMGPGNTERQIWALLTFGSTIIRGTPSYVSHLSRTVREKHLDMDKVMLRKLGVSGEPGASFPGAKDRLRALFPRVTHVQESYGATDIGTTLGMECEAEMGQHIWEDVIILEVLNRETGKPVKPGEQGEMILTDLVNTTSPLLRFRVNDITVLDTGPCPCGRTTARLRYGIVGRGDDMMKIKGINLFPASVGAAVLETPGLAGEYQIVIDRPKDLDTFLIRAEVALGTPKKDYARMESELRQRVKVAVGLDPDVELIPPDSLPRFALKSARVVDKRKGESLEDLLKKAQAQASSA